MQTVLPIGQRFRGPLSPAFKSLSSIKPTGYHRGPLRSLKSETPPGSTESAFNQWIREGHTEVEYVQRQARKEREDGLSLKQGLTKWDVTQTADVAVVGCGPAGLALAAEVGQRGISVVLIGEDMPFVNNYGVWADEFKDLGLDDALDHVWDQAVCYFGEEQEVIIDRQYGRVNLKKLREALIQRCMKAGVGFHSGYVSDIDTEKNGTEARITCRDTETLTAKIVTLASGAASGKFLKYEDGVPPPGAQTAYGVEVELEGYGDRYPSDKMLFMDYRRHHTGIWSDSAGRIKVGKHPDGGDGLWNSHREVPSFLYSMPMGSNRAFLEETCLVARPPLPFPQLKRRLIRRLDAMGLTVKQIIDEEWSYIPVGGPLPIENQCLTAFGSAANLIHPASGYSISRSLREAPDVAAAIHEALHSDLSIKDRSKHVWTVLWSPEKRTQASFHVFGMELLAQMELTQINHFFITFFRLPSYYWRGFLSSSISSQDLLIFAILTLLIAPPGIKARLILHLLRDPSAGHMVKKYSEKYTTEWKALMKSE